MNLLASELGLRARLMLLVVVVTATALLIEGAIMLYTVSTSTQQSLDAGAHRAAQETIDLIEADRLPDPIPAAGSHRIQVIDRQRQVVAVSSGTDRLVAVLEPEELRSALAGEVLWMNGDRAGLDGPVRVLAQQCKIYRWSGERAELTVIVLTPAGEIARSTGILRGVLLVALPVLLCIVGVLSRRMISLTLQPVEALRAGAAEITGTRGTGRLPVPRAQDEIRRLAVTLNDMLDRLERARSRQRTFVGNAAHELRSPLASIQTQLEVSQHLAERASEGTSPSPSESWPQLVPDLLVETGRMSRLVEDLLLLARADDGNPADVRGELFDAGALVDEVIGRYTAARVPVTRTGPHGRPLHLQDARDGEELFLEADPHAIRRILTNLLDNAVRHARTLVTVGIYNTSIKTVLEVRDDGPGIPQTDRARAFERFTRFDEARTRDDGGSGLGLAIVAELVRLHGGRVKLGDALPGLVVTVHLPTTRSADYRGTSPGDRG